LNKLFPLGATRELLLNDNPLFYCQVKIIDDAVGIGDVMQWEADKETDLVAYEICFPPYEDGRYENIK
jgi:hypothetical protein